MSLRTNSNHEPADYSRTEWVLTARDGTRIDRVTMMNVRRMMTSWYLPKSEDDSRDLYHYKTGPIPDLRKWVAGRLPDKTEWFDMGEVQSGLRDARGTRCRLLSNAGLSPILGHDWMLTWRACEVWDTLAPSRSRGALGLARHPGA